jgi:hypothetical protein
VVCGHPARPRPRADVVHTFSAAYWSYLLGPLPAIVWLGCSASQ